MTITPSPQHAPSLVSRWTLDVTGCRLFLEFPGSRIRGLTLEESEGWVELREGPLVGSEVSIRLPPGAARRGDVCVPQGCIFRGSVAQQGTEGEMIVEGRLRQGDVVSSLTLAMVPTRYHRHGGTEFLDLDVSGALPPTECGANRVEGRLRVLRPSPAA